MNQAVSMGEIFSLIFVFALAFGGCWIFVNNNTLAKYAVGRAEDIKATQAMHSLPTPRVGGIIVILAFVIGLSLNWKTIDFNLFVVLSSGVFVFIAGAREDIMRDVSPLIRLISAFISAATAIFFTSKMLTGFGVAELDFVFSSSVVAIVLTMVWSAGFCHALNLIDGLNGLASGYAIVAITALGIIAAINGQQDIVLVSMLLVTALLGFFLLNWPFGKIFLGDAGAYAIGHIIAWIGIILMSRVEGLTAFAVLLILFWPVADTSFAIARRKIGSYPTDQPDRLHFHHLVARSLGLISKKKITPDVRNALSTVILMPLFITPIVFGALYWDEPIRALIALLLFALLFVISYVLGRDFFSRRRFIRLPHRQQRVINDLHEAAIMSPLSGIFIKESLAVDVHIEFLKKECMWKLSTIADSAHGREWEDLFVTDRLAWDEFLATVDNEGIDATVSMEYRTKFDE